jgi:hypothetical protein
VGKGNQTGACNMTTEDMLIDICERRGWALDINYLRGYVALKHKRYPNVSTALKEAQRLENAIQSF